MKRKAIAPVYSSLYIFSNLVVTILLHYIVTKADRVKHQNDSLCQVGLRWKDAAVLWFVEEMQYIYANIVLHL